MEGYILLFGILSLFAGLFIGSIAHINAMEAAATQCMPLLLNKKKHYLIPADDLSAELWSENDELRRTLAKVRETVTRNFDDNRLGQISQVAASLEDEDVRRSASLRHG